MYRTSRASYSRITENRVISYLKFGRALDKFKLNIQEMPDYKTLTTKNGKPDKILEIFG